MTAELISLLTYKVAQGRTFDGLLASKEEVCGSFYMQVAKLFKRPYTTVFNVKVAIDNAKST